MEGYVKSTIENGVASISFFHPQSNSLPSNLLEQLTIEITNAGQDQAVKVIVLKSEGEKVFCAGGSFDEMLSIKDPIVGKAFFKGFANVINAIRKAPKFVIARIQGKTVGGGVGIAAAADYAIALDSASIKLSELDIGIGPYVIGPAVKRKIGIAAFSSLTINATTWKDAAWAQDKGLYAEVHSDPKTMEIALISLTEKLSQYSPTSMQHLKTDFWEGTQNWDVLLDQKAEMVAKLMLEDFFANAIKKFKNK